MGDAQLVNPVPAEEIAAWTAAFATTLLLPPFGDEFATLVRRFERNWVPERSWGVRDAGRWVGTLGTFERTLTVPGPDGAARELAADALTRVTVAGTHRRQGLLTRMLTASLAAAAERGDAVSMLIAGEWPIYGRFGYSPATAGAKYRYLPRRGGRPTAGDATRVREVDAAEVAELAPALYDRARRTRPGEVDRRPPWWDRRLGLDGDPPTGQYVWFAAGSDGLLAWRVARRPELGGALGLLEVGELIAATDEAYRDLWAYLAGIDTVEEICLELRPVDETIRWLLPDGRALTQTGGLDLVWLRLLDVPAALSARGYTVDGRVVLEVVDGQGGWAAGRYLLETAGGEANCVHTDAPADLRIDERTLASIYLGGFRLAQLTLREHVHELRPGAAQLVDLMFCTPRPPWTSTMF